MTPEQFADSLRGSPLQPPFGTRPGPPPNATADVTARLRGDQEPQVESPFSPEARQRAAMFLCQMVQAFQNTNITAGLPSHNAPDFWAEPIDRFGEHTFLNNVVTNWVTVVSFRTGAGRWSRIEQYGHDVSDLVTGDEYPYDGTIRWRMLVMSTPVFSLEDWYQHRGSAFRPRETYFLSSGENNTDLIEFQARRALASPGYGDLTVKCNFRGWMWRPLNTYEGPKVSQTQ